MKKHFSNRLNTSLYELFAGDYYVTNEKDVVLTTILGSCIAVCFYDMFNAVVGMNHFMLPGGHKNKMVKNAKYGQYAIDVVLNEMLEKGAKLQNIKAKVFGAGRMVEDWTYDIGSLNAEFIKTYLSRLHIPITACDLGGKLGRKIYFFSSSLDVFVKKIIDTNLLPEIEKTCDNI